MKIHNLHWITIVPSQCPEFFLCYTNQTCSSSNVRQAVYVIRLHAIPEHRWKAMAGVELRVIGRDRIQMDSALNSAQDRAVVSV